MIRDQKDFATGLLFLAFGAVAVGGGSRYPMGTISDMGPGYFPVLLGGLLVGLAAILIGRSFRAPPVRIGHIAWRPILLVSLASAAFALTVRPLGLMPALTISSLIAALADPANRLRTALILALLLAAGCSLIFVTLLGQPIPLLGRWITG